ncbi:MAG: glycosyltransferase [Elusimicrobia bacterium]|nr:glycosyltransferase [Elusimicrobiota bacterium]
MSPSSIRVLFVGTSTTIGGAEKTLFTLASRLDRSRFDVAGVVSLKPEGPFARRLRDQGIPVESLGLRGLPRPADARRLGAVIARRRPALVHAFLYQAIQLARLAKPRLPFPVKLVSSPRVNYRSRSWPTLLIDRALKDRDDLLIAECEASRRFLLERQRYAPAKTAVILNGVEAGAPPDAAERAEKRREMGFGAADVVVGAAGRLDRQKGFATLLAAMARLKGSTLRCAILGDGPDRRRLEALIRDDGLEGSARLLGERGDMPSWLSAFDVYALPSLWEGLPNALLEAMAAGLPVVASDVDGVPEAVTGGRDGLLVPPERPELLARVLSALAADPDRRAALGAAAKASVAERFTVARMVAEYESAYLTL